MNPVSFNVHSESLLCFINDPAGMRLGHPTSPDGGNVSGGWDLKLGDNGELKTVLHEA